MGYISIRTILSVDRFLSRSINGKVCITLCDFTLHNHQTTFIIGFTRQFKCCITMCHTCQHYFLSRSKFKKTDCCNQSIFHMCRWKKNNIHICSYCGFIRCNVCSEENRFIKCGSCIRVGVEAKEFCMDCWNDVLAEKYFRCKRCNKYPMMKHSVMV